MELSFKIVPWQAWISIRCFLFHPHSSTSSIFSSLNSNVLKIQMPIPRVLLGDISIKWLFEPFQMLTDFFFDIMLPSSSCMLSSRMTSSSDGKFAKFWLWIRKLHGDNFILKAPNLSHVINPYNILFLHTFTPVEDQTSSPLFIKAMYKLRMCCLEAFQLNVVTNLLACIDYINWLKCQS